MNTPITSDTVGSYLIEWTHIPSGDVGIVARAFETPKGPVTPDVAEPRTFQTRRDALAECCKLNEHSERYRYREIFFSPHRPLPRAGLKGKGIARKPQDKITPQHPAELIARDILDYFDQRQRRSVDSV